MTLPYRDLWQPLCNLKVKWASGGKGYSSDEVGVSHPRAGDLDNGSAGDCPTVRVEHWREYQAKRGRNVRLRIRRSLWRRDSLQPWVEPGIRRQDQRFLLQSKFSFLLGSPLLRSIASRLRLPIDYRGEGL